MLRKKLGLAVFSLAVFSGLAPTYTSTASQVGQLKLNAAKTAVNPIYQAKGIQQSSKWIARHGLSSTQYQNAFDQYKKQGYRLTHVSGYGVQGKSYYSAIWEKKSGPALIARHGLTSAQYQSAFNKQARNGYRLVHVSGYSVANKAYYAAIWEKKSGPALIARHGLTSAQYQSAFNKQAKNGYRLVHVDGYSVANKAYYAAIWEKKSGPALIARHGLTSAQYQSAFDKHVKNGYRLVHVSGYSVANKAYYAAIWEKKSGPALIARHGLTSAQYQSAFDKHVKNGYRLVHVSGYSVANKAYYAAIWEKKG
ncbi:hypothetical protein HRE53_30070 (plasmid) [Acaryochloris sp. 'Moss Beach']|uniref:hypothetical protein n=1 Tax=Acaryochloris sp. 'Moss Beach' TaxID=2740837 RepID=UPI001F3D7618|nr:hypothetical protein [Acaryochloris sp. 'Moss Beach']UJB72981.1 hypothetical protein HRE53_30070 [Acaryochloris sp. 'Moss Beach']